MSPKPEVVDISGIAGNASDDLKRLIARPEVLLQNQNRTFVHDIFDRVVATEASILPKAQEPDKMEARVVYEMVVEPDMLNGGGTMHGACSAMLVDNCSTMAIIALTFTTKGSVAPGVSQALNLVYHSPAPLGVKLRIINTTIAVGGRTMSAQTEIWNATNHRIVASGVHIKMHPSPAPSNPIAKAAL